MGLKLRAGFAVNQIAFRVAAPGVHDRQIGDQAALHYIELAVEFALFLAVGDHRAGAGAREEGGNARTAGTDAFCQRALRG